MWHKNVVYIVIRPTRYTKEFVDKHDSFSLTFFNKKFKETLLYLGKVSGKDEDKIENSNLNVKYYNNIPYFKEASISIFCTKLYNQVMEKDCLIDQDIYEKNYPKNDMHTLYIGEIKNILLNKKTL